MTFNGIFYIAYANSETPQSLRYHHGKNKGARPTIEMLDDTQYTEISGYDDYTPAILQALLEELRKTARLRDPELIPWKKVDIKPIPQDDDDRQLILSGNDLEAYQNLPDDTAKDK